MLGSRHGQSAFVVSPASVNETSTEHNFRYVICHPEAIVDACVCGWLKKLSSLVEYIVVDKAHCILQWGTNFRPEFQKVGILYISECKRDCNDSYSNYYS